MAKGNTLFANASPVPEGRGSVSQQGYRPSPSSSSSSLSSLGKDESDTLPDHHYDHPSQQLQELQKDEQQEGVAHLQCIQVQRQHLVAFTTATATTTLTKQTATATTSLARDNRGGLFLPAELILCIFRFLASPQDLRAAILVCKRWCSCGVDLLWSRPALTNLNIVHRLIQTLSPPPPALSSATASPTTTFSYATYVRRLNLNFVTADVTDTILEAFANCKRIERLIMPGCTKTTEQGLRTLLQACPGLYSLDLSEIPHVSDTVVEFIAEHCPHLHTLYLAGCTTITDTSIVALAKRCSKLKRIKLSQCSLLTDQAVLALTQECRQLIEIDIAQCSLMTNKAIQAIWELLPQIRDLNSTLVANITDQAFMSIVPQVNRYEQLRILNLTSCTHITDQTLHRIIPAAPRIRNLVLAKCDKITDYGASVIKILGKHLHYLHLGHCSKVTDRLITSLTQHCTRIRYLDLACCSKLTDASVFALAQLPKLRRIGLVKCSSITDHGIYALLISQVVPQTLERVHLSYCVHLSDTCISALVQQCPKLTHLSLTGVPSFMSRRYHKFCRAPPSEFTPHQREVFCVFSGKGVRELRHYMRENPTLGSASFASIGTALEAIAAAGGGAPVAVAAQGSGAEGGSMAPSGPVGGAAPTGQTIDSMFGSNASVASSIPSDAILLGGGSTGGGGGGAVASSLDPVGHLANFGSVLSYVSLSHAPFLSYPSIAHGMTINGQHYHHYHHHHHQLGNGGDGSGGDGGGGGLETPGSFTSVASPASELNTMDDDESIETEEEDGESSDTQGPPSGSSQRLTQ